VHETQAGHKVLRALDPIGLGGVAVDTVGIFATALVEGQMDERRLARLVDRMKEGPAMYFAEIGEDCGSAIYDMTQWSLSQWDEAFSIRGSLNNPGATPASVVAYSRTA